MVVRVSHDSQSHVLSRVCPGHAQPRRWERRRHAENNESVLRRRPPRV